MTADPAQAARLWGAVQRLHDDLGVTHPPPAHSTSSSWPSCRETLGADALQAALAAGAVLPADQLIAAALGDDPP